MMEKMRVVRPTTAVPMTRLGGRLTCAGAVVRLEVVLGALEVGREPEVALISRGCRDRLDGRELEDRLRVVRDRAVAVDGDRDRAHAEEAERHEAEREHRRAIH